MRTFTTLCTSKVALLGDFCGGKGAASLEADIIGVEMKPQNLEEKRPKFFLFLCFVSFKIFCIFYA